MKEAISHRGPDSSGHWISASNELALGHQRLAIIDTSVNGHQPMESHSSRYVIVYNGEIYNHLDLRKELNQLSNNSIKWIGGSDSETLAVSLDFFGIKKALQKCSGMFAIAIWDKNSKVLTLARDRIGEKPLYYGWVNNKFVFGSELKAIKKFPGFSNKISRLALVNYLHLNYVPSPLSIYDDLYKLTPGTFFEFNPNQLSKQLPDSQPYWSFKETVKKDSLIPFDNEDIAIIELEKKLDRSITSQMLSDVPLGAFLSGGIDSSLIVSLMQKNSIKPIKTFTIGFQNESYDESSFAADVSNHLGTDHTTLNISDEDTISVIPKLGLMYDEPFADSSQIPTFLVAKEAQKNVTVALSGDAGDELFGGYNRYTHTRQIWNVTSKIPFSVRKKLAQLALSIPIDKLDIGNSIYSKISKNHIPHFGSKVHKLSERFTRIDSLKELCVDLAINWAEPSSLVKGIEDIKDDDLVLSAYEFDPDLDDISNMMLCDSINYLPDDILCKVDRAAMSVSLETRVPFLDPAIISTAWRMPLHFKIRNKVGKKPLRTILNKYVPSSMIERPKSGFAIPIGDWLRGPLREWCEELLDEKILIKQGFFNLTPIIKMWNQHKKGEHDWTPKLWGILMFQLWLKEHHPEF
jgi:asparagine synthase (glutamine-hydrolysing)